MHRNNLYVFLFVAGLVLAGASLYTLYFRLPAKPNNTEAYCSLVFGSLMVIIGALAWYTRTYKVHRQIKRSTAP